jgi:hypothetical protein
MKRRIAVGALCALFAAGSISRAADPPTPPPYEAPWYKRWFGIGPEPPKPPPIPERRDPAAEAAAQRAAAEADLFRRLEVCDELRQVAAEKKDPKLAAQADELERRASDLYRRQTAHLPASRMIPSEDRIATAMKTGSSATAAADKLAPPAKPDVGRTGQANAFREVKP